MPDDATSRCRYTWAATDSHASCCYRATWGDRDRCIWHADVDGDVEKPVEALRDRRETPANRRLNRGGPGECPAELLDGARLDGTGLEESLPLARCSLRDATLSGADLRNGDLQGVDLWRADLAGALLLGTDLAGANLRRADLSGAFPVGADLADASLRDADLSGADLRIARLPGADLRGADLADVAVNQATRCGRQTRAERDASRSNDWDRIARAYHDLKSRFSDRGLVGKARRHHLLEREARGREARAGGGLSGSLAYASSLASKYLTGYGVDYRRVLVVMGAVFGLSTAVYRSAGIEDSVYYSVVTFTTAPPTPPPAGLAAWVAMGETLVGTVLVVLLGYVLGNRESF